MPTYLSPGVYVEETRLWLTAYRRSGDSRRRLRRPRREGAVQSTHPDQQLDAIHPDVRRLRSTVPAWRNPSSRTSRTVAGTPTSSASETARLKTVQPQPRRRSSRRRRAYLAGYRVVALDPETPRTACGWRSPNSTTKARKTQSGLKLVVYRDGQVVEEHPGVTTEPRQDQRRHRRQRGIADHPARTDQRKGPLEELHAGMRGRASGTGRRAVATAPARLSAPTTTSATSPSAPASRAWRRSTRSPWSACRT